MATDSTSSRRSFRERLGIKKPPPPPPPPAEESSLLQLIAPGSWVWEVAGPLANSLGLTSSGVAAGSIAAKAVALASSAGSASAMATLATPVGLCLVTSCVVVAGGGVLIGRALFFRDTPKVADDAWIFVEDANDPKLKKNKNDKDAKKGERFAVAVFDDEKAARKAFKRSRARSKALFGPQKALVESRGWQDQMRRVVAAM